MTDPESNKMWIWDSEPDKSRCRQKLLTQHGSKMYRDQVEGQRKNWLLSQLIWRIYFSRRSASENIILHWMGTTLKNNLKYIFEWKLITWLTTVYVIPPQTLGENQLAGFLRFLEVCFPSIYIDLRPVFLSALSLHCWHSSNLILTIINKIK